MSLAVIEEALRAMEADPCPEADTSSHWKRYGAETVVARKGGRLVLEGVGFGSVHQGKTGVLYWLERLTYARAAASLKSHRRIWRMTKRLAADLSLGLTYDVWKYSMALATLADHWEAHALSPRTFALIGDGYGVLGALIHRLLPEARLYFIDLPKILVFQIQTMADASPGAPQRLLSSGTAEPAAVNFVFPKDIERIEDRIDCAINIASMQEMKGSSIDAYFRFLRRRSGPGSRFYCVNRARKELPGGEVAEFARYPWRDADTVFLNGACPYYTHFLSYRTLPRGPRLFGMRVPGVNHFDGPMVHRLAHLQPE
jgi:hypothetical protein